MAKLDLYTRQYTKRDNSTWQVIKLSLPLSVKPHIIYYHNKSCFYKHNYKKIIQLDSITKQQKMLGKSKGKLIYVSNFIRLKGRVNILKLNLDARKIIYPGVGGDLQQDIKQLLVQILITLNIFELKYLNYIAVLVFD